MIQKTLITLALALVTSLILLSGCGSSSPASSTAAAPTPTYPTLPASSCFYVNAATGVDTNAGTQAAPFKTITKALAMASTGQPTNIFVSPGTYDTANGEIFPIKIASNGVNLIGNIANKGVGTTISGGGGFILSAAGGWMGGGTINTTVGIPSGISASIQGFEITGGGWSDIVADKTSFVTISSNTMSGTATWGGIAVMQGAKAIITSNNVKNTGIISIWISDNATVATLRGNTITNYSAGAWQGAIHVLGGSPTVDAGTVASPGNNTIIGSSTSVGLAYEGVITPVVSVSGNTWKANVQGADAAGHYTAGLVIPVGTAWVAGNNYSNPAGTAAINFYAQAGTKTGY